MSSLNLKVESLESSGLLCLQDMPVMYLTDWTYIVKIICPSTETCGTPQATHECEDLSLTLTKLESVWQIWFKPA